MEIDSNVIVIGEQITGLYAGIKALEKGYSVIIIERLQKQCTISEDKLVISDNHHSLKKLLIKNNITLTPIDNKMADLFTKIIDKAEKIPLPVQHSISLEDLCNTFLSLNEFNLFKIRFKDYLKLKNVRLYNALIMIKKNYINNDQYIINEGISVLLNRLRGVFIEQGGKIIYSTAVRMISIDKNYDTFRCFTKNKILRSNIVISTLNLANTLKIYKWNHTQLDILKNIISVPKKNFNESKINKASEKLLNTYNVSTPYDIINDKKHYLWKDLTNVIKYYGKIKNIMGDNVHFYICNDCFSKNQGWICGAIDMINDVMNRI